MVLSTLDKVFAGLVAVAVAIALIAVVMSALGFASFNDPTSTTSTTTLSVSALLQVQNGNGQELVPVSALVQTLAGTGLVGSSIQVAVDFKATGSTTALQTKLDKAGGIMQGPLATFDVVPVAAGIHDLGSSETPFRTLSTQSINSQLGHCNFLWYTYDGISTPFAALNTWVPLRTGQIINPTDPQLFFENEASTASVKFVRPETKNALFQVTVNISTQAAAEFYTNVFRFCVVANQPELEKLNSVSWVVNLECCYPFNVEINSLLTLSSDDVVRVLVLMENPPLNEQLLTYAVNLSIVPFFA